MQKWPSVDQTVPGRTTTPASARFERLQSNVRLRVLPGAVEPDPAETEKPVEVIDSAKTFIGPNATYYDERWRWMDWRGRSRSWNGPAAASFGVWLAYRRMYGLAALHAIWLVLLASLAVAGVPAVPLILAEGAVVLGLGLYGNTLYAWHFRRVASKVYRLYEDYHARVAALGERGGTDPRAARIMALGQLLALAVLIPFAV